MCDINATTISDKLLDRAHYWVKMYPDITYRMGGERVESNGVLDCSAFIWNVLGLKKKDRNTDWILKDATTKQTFFKQIDTPIPGCIAVYGTAWERIKLPDGTVKVKRHSGHVGIVSSPSKFTVIDCSSSEGGIREHIQKVLFVGPKYGNRDVVFCLPIKL